MSDPASKPVSRKPAGDVTVAAAEPTPAEITKFVSGCRLLKVGVSGKETQAQTKQLQKTLVQRGFLKDKQYEPGKYDEATRAAIVEFQTQYNLQVDGVVGQQTWSRLKFENAKEIPPPGIELLKAKGAPEGEGKAKKETNWEGKAAPAGDGYSKHEPPKTVLKPPPVSEGNVADKLIAAGVPAAAVALVPFLDGRTKKGEAGAPKTSETTAGKSTPSQEPGEKTAEQQGADAIATTPAKQGAKPASDSELAQAAIQAKELSEPRGHFSHTAQVGVASMSYGLAAFNPYEKLQQVRAARATLEEGLVKATTTSWGTAKSWVQSRWVPADGGPVSKVVKGTLAKVVNATKSVAATAMNLVEKPVVGVSSLKGAPSLAKVAGYGAAALTPAGWWGLTTYAGSVGGLQAMRALRGLGGVFAAKFAADDLVHAYEVYKDPHPHPLKTTLAVASGVMSTVAIVPVLGIPAAVGSWLASRAEKAYG